MIKFQDIKELHIEVSSKCQASCPQCIRNISGGITNPLITENDMTYDQYVNIVTPLLSQLNHIIFCGNVGDPVMNSELIDMIEYTTNSSPNIHIDLHTNGSIRNSDWWTKLATVMPMNHNVYFGIDGLGDTHSLHRVGTVYEKIIENAKAFNNMGGNSIWTFITFKHNEHQLEKIKQLAKEYKFKSFQEKQTTRFMGDSSLAVLDKHGEVSHYIEPPTESKIVFIKRNSLDNYKELFKDVTVSCKAVKDSSVYIDSMGVLWPCCFLANIPITVMSTNYSLDNHRLIKEIPLFNLNTHDIISVTNSIEWQNWDKHIKSIPMCSRTCGNVTFSQPKDQFIASA
jgi:MoaA/NifB/PqqE/SkfB family radical SAM enzyme